MPTPPTALSRWRGNRVRLLLLLALILTTVAIGHFTAITDHLDRDRISSLVNEAGAWGWALYVAVFSAGEFLHVPGIVFVAAGILIYGQALGFAAAWSAAVISVCVSFALVRGVGGSPLAQIEKPWARRMLARLDTRPVRTVFLLRLGLFLAPPLNYALALTRIRFRDYALGSALGLLAPVLVVTILFDWLFATA